jgi:hypothetical protein
MAVEVAAVAMKVMLEVDMSGHLMPRKYLPSNSSCRRYVAPLSNLHLVQAVVSAIILQLRLP